MLISVGSAYCDDGLIAQLAATSPISNGDVIVTYNLDVAFMKGNTNQNAPFGTAKGYITVNYRTLTILSARIVTTPNPGFNPQRQPQGFVGSAYTEAGALFWCNFYRGTIGNGNCGASFTAPYPGFGEHGITLTVGYYAHTPTSVTFGQVTESVDVVFHDIMRYVDGGPGFTVASTPDSQCNDNQRSGCLSTSPQISSAPRILWNERDVTNLRQSVPVGQRIDLRLDSGTLPIQTQAWSIPGTKVKGYVVSLQRGTVEELTDLSQSSVKFYWVDAGTSRQVTLSYTLSNGSNGAISTTFDVVGPTSPFIGAPTGSVDLICTVTYPKLKLAPPCLLLTDPVREMVFGGTPNNIGISFTISAADPPGYKGALRLVQIVDSDTYIVQLDNHSKQTCTGFKMLDAGFPYPVMHDSPGLILPPKQVTGAQILDGRATMTFRTYLLWFPAISGPSVPVPLGFVRWRWFGHASFNQTKEAWNLDHRSSGSADAFQADSQYPIWDGFLSRQGRKLSTGIKCQ